MMEKEILGKLRTETKDWPCCRLGLALKAWLLSFKAYMIWQE